MRVNERMKKVFSILLCLCMVLQYVPTTAFAIDAAESGLCEHHTEHTAECGYVAAVEAHECHYACDECAAKETTEPSTESAPVCDCGTDDALIHATTCPVYVAPENPQCYCAEKCTEANVWCDICGFDYAKCGGTDRAVGYSGYEIEGGSLGLDSIIISTGGADKGIMYRVLTMPAAGENGTVSVYGHNGVSGEITIPGVFYVEQSGTYQFYVTAIEANAFQGCSNLTSVMVQQGTDKVSIWKSIIKTIGDGAFKGTQVQCATHRFTASAACDVCDYVCGHAPSENAVYTVNDDVTHSYTCTICGHIVTEEHTIIPETGECICGVYLAVAYVDNGSDITYFDTVEKALAACKESVDSKLMLFKAVDELVLDFVSAYHRVTLSVGSNAPIGKITVKGDVALIILDETEVSGIHLENGQLVLEFITQENFHKCTVTASGTGTKLNVHVPSGYIICDKAGNVFTISNNTQKIEALVHSNKFSADNHDWTGVQTSHVLSCPIEGCGVTVRRDYSYDLESHNCLICGAKQPYAITVNPPKNGTVTADKTYSYGSELITLTVDPAEGYVTESLEVFYQIHDGAEEASIADHTITPTPVADQPGKYTFTMPNANVYVNAAFAVCEHSWENGVCIHCGVEDPRLANPVLDISKGNISLQDGALVSGYDAQGNFYKDYPYSGVLTITGTSESNTVTVMSGNHKIVLQDCRISSTLDAAFAVESGATAELTLSGTNTLSSGYKYAGLAVPEGAALVINGPGSLTATGNDGAAGIGGGLEANGGTITINSGTVKATGGGSAAGIGGGQGANGGTITINSGTVEAKGGGSIGSDGGGAGIGSGANNRNQPVAGGTITINGGKVEAKGGSGGDPSGSGAGIGGGGGNATKFAGTCGNVTINGGTVIATSGTNSNGALTGLDIGRGGKNDPRQPNTGAITITGGNIKASTMLPTPKDASGNALTPVTITLDGAAAAEKLYNLFDSNNNKIAYNISDSKLLDDNETSKLYVYLPVTDTPAVSYVIVKGCRYLRAAEWSGGSSSGYSAIFTKDNDYNFADVRVDSVASSLQFGYNLARNVFYDSGQLLGTFTYENGSYDPVTLTVTDDDDGMDFSTQYSSNSVDIDLDSSENINITLLRVNTTNLVPDSYVKVGSISVTVGNEVLANVPVEVKLVQVAPQVTPPTAKTLTYSGKAQELVTAGETEESAPEMQYSLDNENWSTAIPTGTETGEYTVYYKVPGDNSFTEVAPASVKVSIQAKEVTAPTFKDVVVNGIEPLDIGFKLMDGDTEIPASEYTVSYSQNTAAGTAAITITDKDGGNYIVSGSTTVVYCDHSDSARIKPTDNGDGTHDAICTVCGAMVADNASHTLTYCASGNTITESCSGNCGHTGTAAISAENTTYDGTEKETATVAYSEGWLGDKPSVSYANNVFVGTATAEITVGGVTASVAFTIAKQVNSDPMSPVTTSDVASTSFRVTVAEADRDKDLEYCINGGAYQNVTLGAGGSFIVMVDSSLAGTELTFYIREQANDYIEAGAAHSETVQLLSASTIEAQWTDSENNNQTGTLAEAIAAKPTYIKLLTNANLSAGATINFATTLDLNGHAVNAATLHNSGSLTVTGSGSYNGRIENRGKLVIDANIGGDVEAYSGNLTVTGGTIQSLTVHNGVNAALKAGTYNNLKCIINNPVGINEAELSGLPYKLLANGKEYSHNSIDTIRYNSEGQIIAGSGDVARAEAWFDAPVSVLECNPVTPRISNQPVDASYFLNDTAAALSVTATNNDDGGTLSYQWYSDTDDDTTGGTAITGAISATYTPSTDAVGTTYYYCVVTNSKTDLPSKSATSVAAKVTVEESPHRCEWTYTVSGTTITATCANTDGYCADPEQSITLIVPDSYTYSGEALYSASVDGSIEGVTHTVLYTGTKTDYSSAEAPVNADTYTVKLSAGDVSVSGSFTITKAQAVITMDTTTITVTYGENVILPTATTNFGTVVCDKTADDLVNAGTYTVTYSVEGTANYEGAEKKLTVVVAKKAVEEPTVTGTYTYSGREHTAQLTGVESYMTVASGNKATNAGNYEVIITLDGNHKWADGSDGKIQWSVGNAEFGDVYVSQSEMLTYNGTAQTPEVHTDADSEGGQTATFTYRLTENESYGEMPSFTDAGTYTIYFKASAPNHNDATGSFTVTVDKAKAEITVDTNPITVTYGDTVELPDVTANFGTVTCDKTVDDLVNVGTYIVAYTIVGTDNYDGDTKTVTVTINAKPVTAADVKLNGSLTYNGKEQTQPITVTEGITYEVSGNKATNAGAYELTVKGTGNYTGSVTLDWTIAKAKLTITADSKVIYIGEKVPTLTYTASGLVGGDKLTKEPVLTTNADADQAGSYTITAANADAGDNYTITYVSGSLRIMDKETKVETKIEQTELTEVPEGLKDTQFDTVEEIKEELISKILATSTGYSAENMVHYDVELHFSLDGGDSWILATEENFPTEGITVILPYPEGTNARDYEFVVSHMFTVTSQRLGTVAGEVEMPKVEETANGIRVTLNGLSPVTVAARYHDHTGGIATCTDKAICSICGTAYGELDATNHAGGTEVKNAKEATCGAEGYTGDTYCKGCNEVVEKGTTIKATGEHNYGDWKVVKEPTKTTKGEKQRSCSVCGHVDPKEIPVLSDTPATGDDSNIMLYSSMFTVSLAGLVVLLLAAKKHKQETA